MVKDEKKYPMIEQFFQKGKVICFGSEQYAKVVNAYINRRTKIADKEKSVARFAQKREGR